MVMVSNPIIANSMVFVPFALVTKGIDASQSPNSLVIVSHRCLHINMYWSSLWHWNPLLPSCQESKLKLLPSKEYSRFVLLHTMQKEMTQKQIIIVAIILEKLKKKILNNFIDLYAVNILRKYVIFVTDDSFKMIRFLVIFNLRTQNLIFSLLVTLMYFLLLYYTVFTYRSYYLYKAKTCTTIKRVTNMGINIINVKNLAKSRTLFFLHWNKNSAKSLIDMSINSNK